MNIIKFIYGRCKTMQEFYTLLGTTAFFDVCLFLYNRDFYQLLFMLGVGSVLIYIVYKPKKCNECGLTNEHKIQCSERS